MLRPFNLNELRGHHGDARRRGHVVPGLLRFGNTELRCVELQNIVLPARIGGCLSRVDVSVSIYCDDGLFEAPSSRCSDSHQSLLCESLIGRYASIVPVVFNLFGQFVKFWDDELFARVKSMLAARQELKRSHCSCSDERQFGKWILILFVIPVFGKPLVEQAVAPVIRQRICDERRKLLVFRGIGVAEYGKP